MNKTAIVLLVVALFFAWLVGEGRPLWMKAVFVIAFMACGFGYQWADTKQNEVYARIRAVTVSKHELTAFECGAIKARGGEELVGACDKFKDLTTQ